MKDTLRFSSVLFLICFFCATMLAFVHGVTEPKIAEQKRLAQERALKEVLPENASSAEKKQIDEITFYEAKDKSGALIGFCFLAERRGYSSNIKTMVSITPEGKIIKVKVLEQNETPGIGSQITEDKFLGQFLNQRFDTAFDTITGATISSEALINSIKEKAARVLAAANQK
ncbi:MAG: FMN-binding protein [Candidatus Omnitrophica bacterium]|nr:FMN-binding protein [Candidatus Omnitrophota bacterium]